MTRNRLEFVPGDIVVAVRDLRRYEGYCPEICVSEGTVGKLEHVSYFSGDYWVQFENGQYLPVYANDIGLVLNEDLVL